MQTFTSAQICLNDFSCRWKIPAFDLERGHAQVQISQRRASSQIYIQRGKCLAHFQLWFNETDWGQGRGAGPQNPAIRHTCGNASGEMGARGVAGTLEVLARHPEWEGWFSLCRPPFLSYTQSGSSRRQGAEAVPDAHKGPSDSVWRVNLATTERKWSSQLLSLRSTLRLCFGRILSSKITPPAQCIISEGLGKSAFKSVARQWYGEGGGGGLVGTDSSETGWERCQCHSVWKAGCCLGLFVHLVFSLRLPEDGTESEASLIRNTNPCSNILYLVVSDFTWRQTIYFSPHRCNPRGGALIEKHIKDYIRFTEYMWVSIRSHNSTAMFAHTCCGQCIDPSVSRCGCSCITSF